MLNERSKWLRREIIKLSKANGGYHFGGCFSCAEILLTLYDEVLTCEDRFILSKGHSCWGLYVLLRERGLNPSLEGHPHLDLANGIHWTTGSEGHGFPAGVGMALARKIQKRPGRIYVLIGDGECQEGTTWESMLMASRHGLDNLIVIVDDNKIQGSGRTTDILPVIPSLPAAANAAGWTVWSVDGHDHIEINRWLAPDVAVDRSPIMIFAETVKGKGVSFMEDNPNWHARWMDDGLEKQAMEELK
jgi:transketolase